jgi:hypothetical protein
MEEDLRSKSFKLNKDHPRDKLKGDNISISVKKK